MIFKIQYALESHQICVTYDHWLQYWPKYKYYIGFIYLIKYVISDLYCNTLNCNIYKKNYMLKYLEVHFLTNNSTIWIKSDSSVLAVTIKVVVYMQVMNIIHGNMIGF